MSPEVHRRNRLNVVLQMVTALITAILLGQLWLFTVTLDAMENPSAARFATRRTSTALESRFAPLTPATTANVVTIPSLAAYTMSRI